MIKRLLSILFATILIFSCIKVSELSKNGNVESFKIIPGTISEGVELSETPTTIDEEEKTININISKGQYISPIEFKAAIEINEAAIEILNIDKDKQESTGSTAVDQDGNPVYIFSYTDTAKAVVFYVIAENGHAVKWEVRLNFKALGEATDILGFNVKAPSGNTIITEKPTIQTGSKKVDLYFNGNYPFTIESTITIDKDSKLEENTKLGSGADTDTKTVDLSFTFESATDIQTITIESQSGNLTDWSIQLHQTAALVAEALPADQLSRTALNYYSMAPQAGIAEMALEFSIDSVKAEVVIYTDSSDAINLNINPQAGSEALGNQNPTSWPSKLYMMDTQSKLYREWSVSKSSSTAPVIVKSVTFDTAEKVNKIPEITDKKITFITSNLNASGTLTNLVFQTNKGESTFSGPYALSGGTTESVIISGESWTLAMKHVAASGEALLSDFEFTNTSIDWSRIYIENTAKKITVAVNQITNLEFTPTFTISPNASITSSTGRINNNVVSNIEIDTPVTLTVYAQDGATTDVWTIEFIDAPQLENNKYEEVSDNEHGYEIATSWMSANVYKQLGVTLIGTTVSKEGDKDYDNTGNGNAIKVITQKQDAIVFGYVIAAATSFKGEFDFAMALQYPRKLTKFGIPFRLGKMPENSKNNARTDSEGDNEGDSEEGTPSNPKERVPLSFSIDVKYKAGPIMQQAIPVSGFYTIHPAEGNDNGQVFLEMINYTDNGGNMEDVPNSYSGDGKNGIGETAKGVNLLSRGELQLDGTNASYNTWNRDINIDFVNKTTELTKDLPVTHVVFMLTSSMMGDIYLGAIGSQLFADNVIINYYKPEDGAVIKYNKD